MIDEHGHGINGAILDLSLKKGETSIEIAQRLRQMGIPMMFLTGDDTPLRLEGEEPMVLIKPVSVTRLRGALSDLLAGASQ